jgi:Cu2+-exporting ATPase
VWIIVGLKGRNESASKAVPNAITYAVAVLAISCPCALGLAVPMVMVTAGGIAARGGVVIKSAECTAGSRKVTVVFDKTGTLTEANLDVLAEEYFGSDRDQAVAIAKALTAGNSHPVSTAVAKYLEQNLTKPATGGDVHVIPGAGVEVVLNGTIFRAGNPQWTQHETHPDVTRFLDDGMITLLITRDSVPKPPAWSRHSNAPI